MCKDGFYFIRSKVHMNNISSIFDWNNGSRELLFSDNTIIIVAIDSQLTNNSQEWLGVYSD